MPLRPRHIFLTGALIVALFCPRVQAQEETLSRIQAALFFNFVLYTTWPDPTPPTKPLAIRVLQSPEIAKDMQDAPEKSAHNRELDLRDCASVSELHGADAVFIPAKAAESLTATAWSSFGPATMVVSDAKDAITNGATIQLMLLGGKPRFAIGLRHAKELVISSKLLRLASEVQE